MQNLLAFLAFDPTNIIPRIKKTGISINSKIKIVT